VSAGHVIVVGGGFSGLMLAVHLLADPRGPRVTLIERRPEFCRGRAYADMGQPWRLNVCAGNMSAFPADREHFLRWLRARDPEATFHTYAERRVYGLYLQDVLREAAARPDAPSRLTLLCDEAVGGSFECGDAVVQLQSGGRVHGDHLVLAVGSGSPVDLPGLGGLNPDRYVADPWSRDLTEGLKSGDAVLLLGAGLTMVDAAMALSGVEGLGTIHCLSRRGVLPRGHGVNMPPPPEPDPALPTRPSQLLRHVRRHAQSVGWRAAVDALRPVSTTLWRTTPDRERARFLRHLRPWWDAHRHRLAPELTERLEALLASGQLRGAAGRLVSAEPTEDGGVLARWRPRGGGEPVSLRVRRVINCTGLGGVSTAAADPLLGDLLAQRLIRSDAQRLGLDVDRDSRAVGADGTPNPRLHVLGPLTQGAFWEATAVPDLRNRALLLAEALRAA
jgi:uncharacterized NAD(P)/FAD-binding protein YdhS